jgi:uncharacterized membrane protein YdjX (TVP38/TMEM64 family)
MQSEKRTISLLSYYLLVSSLTNLVCLVITVVLLSLLPPIEKFDKVTIIIAAIFLFIKGLLVGLVIHYYPNQLKYDQVFRTNFIGFYWGRLYGLILGAFLGAAVWNWLGAIIGALSLYFIGRWLGPMTSRQIGNLLELAWPISVHE